MNKNAVHLERIELRNSSGDLIAGDLRYVQNENRKPVVVICHSFMAFKDWGFFPHIGEKLAESGFVSLVFNFSHNGVVEGGQRITDFEKFEQNTFSKELEDLDAVVSSIAEGNFGEEIIDREKIALLGHSRGGGIAIVHSASNARVKALVTMSSISTFDRWTNHQKKQWRTSGYLPLARDTSVSPLRSGLGLLNDIESNRERLSIANASSKIQVPWLVVHGKEDITVKSREAQQLYDASNIATTELMILEHVGHLYNATSRADDNYTTLNKVLDLVIHWLNNKL